MRLVKSFVKYFAPLPLELAQIRCWGIVLVIVVVLDWWASAGKGPLWRRKTKRATPFRMPPRAVKDIPYTPSKSAALT